MRSFRRRFITICRTEVASVKSTQKMIPFITCEISLGQYVCELVFGVNVFDLDFRVQIETSQGQLCGFWNMSHCRVSSLYDHFDHCFIVFETQTTKLPDEKNSRLKA